ncbi:MAG: FkbM family methyltransferase [Granulosicoccaceae bacterium]|jgi:FkbM family methyltransferase
MEPIKAWPRAVSDNRFIRKLLYHRDLRKLFAALGPRFVIRDIDGVQLYCDLEEGKGPGRTIIKYGEHDPFLMQLMKDFIRRDKAVIDVGANIGSYSLVASRYTAAPVYAFEPEPFNYNVLLNNIALNNADNVHAYQKAASNEPGTLQLYLNPFNQGDHRCYRSGEGRDCVDIEAVRIDDELAGEDISRIGFIKIDVQGFELMTVQGMRHILATVPGLRVITEFEADSMREAGYEPGAYLAFFAELGYRMQFADEVRRELHDISREQLMELSTRMSTINLLFSKS